MSFRRISTACAVVGALVLFAGCDGSSGTAGSGTTGSGTTGATTSSTPSPSPMVTPATEDQLRKIVLQATDLPGWKASPADPQANAGSNDTLAACLSTGTGGDQVATIESDDFDLGDATIYSSATSYTFPSDLNTDIAVLKSPKFVPCITRQLKEELANSIPAGVSLGTLSVKFTPGSGTGPANVVGSGLASVPVVGSGGRVTAYLSFVYLIGPLIEAEVDGENIGAPVPARVLQSAVNAVAARTAAAG